MRLAIFGATGTVGSELLAQALDTGHEVRALARTPSKLAPRARLTVLAGDVRDPRAVARAIDGCDAVLSTLGSTDRRNQGVRSHGLANILDAMRQADVRRVVVMGGFHLRFEGDRGDLGQALIAPVLRLAYGNGLLEDTRAMAGLLRASDLDWTLVRAPRVVSKRRSAASATGSLSLGPWSKVGCPSVAAYMLRCVGEPTAVRRAPMICDRASERWLRRPALARRARNP
jgi:putative NADH-flavin reductase